MSRLVVQCDLPSYPLAAEGEYRCLIIEDDDIDHVPSGCLQVRTSAEAVEALYSQPWEMVFWDHDLGGDDNSMRAVKVMCERFWNDGIPMPKIDHSYVHSMNPVGAAGLHAALSGMHPTTRIALPFKRTHRAS